MIKLQTERLTLRYFTTDDAPFLLTLLNTEGFKKYVGDRNVRTVAEAVAYNKRFTDHYEQHGFGFYLVEMTADRTPIGMCGFCKRDSLPHADIGFSFLPEYEGKGFAYEAAAATMLHARNDYHIGTICGITVPYNDRSIRLLERIGLRFEKRFFMAGDDEELCLYQASPSPSEGGETEGLTESALSAAGSPPSEGSGEASAIRAILDEYARALNDLKNVIQPIDNQQLTHIFDAKTKDEDCRSVQTVLSHVVSSGFNYAIAIQRHLGEGIDFIKTKKLKTANEYIIALDEMMAYNVAVFQKYPNIKLEEYNPAKKILTRWGQIYDVDQLMEHAICHVLRHRRQIERWEPRL
jgi:RimJ/RimL family protein N-acetyltransferase/uncharacterized damage-inducible protein DinB